ncbi:MAG TPA: ABC transporter permease, partial [Usitatibacteraceae bacterium]|nr:ABC transporter permease [Usitatibacteraceae bacterium]
MSLFRLALAYLASRPLLSALNAAMLALGVATIAFLLLVADQAEERLTRDAKSVDLVVGAKGSPLQLILSTVFHADVPTGNIGLEEARAVQANPMVASATPLALGDSFHGSRIVGTDESFLALYGATVAQGRLFSAEMEAVVGAEVARRE